MKRVRPFDPQSEEVRQMVSHVLGHAPVQHLTEEEVICTLRLLQLRDDLHDTERSRYAVTLYRDDERLEGCTRDVMFLALLLDADSRDTLLMSKKCMYTFGLSIHRWRTAAKECPICTTASATVVGSQGGYYLGKGWKIAPHIKRLINWIDKQKQESHEEV